MMDVPQYRFVRFHLTDSLDESTFLVREVELSFLKGRGVKKKIKKWKLTIKKLYLCSHS